MARRGQFPLLGLVLLIQQTCQVNLWSTETRRFEVASVKVAAPLSGGTGFLTKRLDPQQVTYRHVNIKTLVMDAWRVKYYQVRGPGWLEDVFYDIVAKFPEGSGSSALPEMLQVLLKERFSLHLHNETAEEPGYALLVDKSGPKLRKSQAIEVPTNSNGLPSIVALQEARRAGKAVKGITYDSSGRIRGGAVTMAMLADSLASLLGRPVIDSTGLTGDFDVTLEMSPSEVFGPASALFPKDNGAEHSSVFVSITKLGLRLQPRRIPITFFVIDKADKVPSEN